ncbi:MAG: alpha/beta hydrolase [Elusimicrobia bacterium]|nr:alpha/beta hydrolase [Elusimicrobiota bacterium]
MIFWTVVGVLLFVAGIAALCFWGAGVILHPPAMSPMWVFPEQFGLPYERVSFTTKDGLLLKGWLLPSATGDKRTIIMCHGWGDNKGELLKQTYFLNETAGFNLLYFDFRSHGESEGEITTIGGLETIDFDAAVNWLKTARPELAERAGVFGLSMGAAVTVAALPGQPGLKCAAVESPYSDYKGVISRWGWNKFRVPRFPLIDFTLWMLRLRVGNPKIDIFNPVEAAPHIAPRPLFVIGGSEDDLMPVDDVTRVFNAAHEPKQLWIVPGAFHAKCREAAGMEYDTRVSGFFNRNL